MSMPKPRRAERLVKALVRAHRWRRQIESGRAKSITDLAEQEGVADAYVCWLLPRAGHHRGDPGWAAAEGLNFADILETWSPLRPHL